MLYAFSQNAAEEGNAVHCTYALGGWVPASPGSAEKVHRMVLVDEQDLPGVVPHTIKT
jgi:hypothetical protein